MSRLFRYVESLQKFIRDRSCLLDKDMLPNDEVKNLIHNRIKKSDLTLSILMLTVINSQNKKNGITLQGYYSAVTVQFLQTMIELLDKDDNTNTDDADEDEHNDTNTNQAINYLMMCSYRSLCQNLETVKNTLEAENSTRIFLDSMKIYYDTVNYSRLLNKHVFKLTSNDDKESKAAYQQVYKWYIKDDNSLNEKFKKIKQITKESYNEYLDKKIGALCEIAVCTGWLVGSGNPKKLKKLKKTAKHFANFYKVANDFLTIEYDIRNNNDGVTTNYILNYGLQNAYEFFMDNKKRFIEDAMTFDMYSSTVKEMINSMEAKVDNVIDETSPDLKSNFSKATLDISLDI